MNLYVWAQRWNVPLAALRDLQETLGLYTPPLAPNDPCAGKGEAFAQATVRLEASQKGVRLWRNNVGALKDSSGRVVRFGLGNDSPAINKVIKSSDLIGWRRVVITQGHVGLHIAQFVAREVKAPGHQVTPDRDPHERAQLAFLNLVNADGGDACFVTGTGTL